ncbi:adenine specific DNA methylase Mod [Roseibium sp. TrichSKD4]|uniref:hypothetical protein n=1 Tax=Roseibium sp. TrichSKD4 TaxID=744980 RepID=UPI0001E56E07|nr:hypothetical protein [Roseibium sp. TrichSKD4]EFO31538.1 adenine specific DNA methylase Mod [Roseibium sp. TrichSKD4]
MHGEPEQTFVPIRDMIIIMARETMTPVQDIRLWTVDDFFLYADSLMRLRRQSEKP